MSGTPAPHPDRRPASFRAPPASPQDSPRLSGEGIDSPRQGTAKGVATGCRALPEEPEQVPQLVADADDQRPLNP